MKRKIIYTLAVLSLCGLFSCNGNKEEKTVDKISVSGSKELTVDSKGGASVLSIEASGKWTSKSGASWLTVEPAGGDAGTVTVIVTAAANESYESRSSYVEFTCGTASDRVNFTQGELICLDADETPVNFPAEGGQKEVEVRSNVDYTVSVSAEASEWLTAVKTKAVETSRVVLTAAASESPAQRKGIVTIAGEDFKRTIQVTQEGFSFDPVLEADVARHFSPAAGDEFTVKCNTNLDLSISTPDWVSCATVTENGEYKFTVGANSADTPRSGNITISGEKYGKNTKQTIAVSQKSPKSLYVLAVGNSFSRDPMEYLYNILAELGYTDIYLGNLIVSGCSLEMHAGYLTKKSGVYTYRTNSNGTWVDNDNYVGNTALAARDWDYVSMQQVSQLTGVPSSYEPYLTTVYNIVNELSPNSKKVWQMTWAYQSNSTHSGFPTYNSDQMTMYNAIISTTQSNVVAKGGFDKIIPSGTAVQNLRTSFIGDTFTRDGYHMSYDIGRFLVALMWARQLSDKSIAEVKFTPAGYALEARQVEAIKEAVENAYKTPFSITNSTYPGTVDPPVSGDLLETFKNAGYSISDYDALELEITHNAYWHSASTYFADLQVSGHGGSSANLKRFAATQRFTKAEIPNGTVIVLKQGYKYRPDKWIDLKTANTSSTRPGDVIANSANLIAVVDDAWWGSFNYVGFNIAKADNAQLDDQSELDDVLAVFVPKKQ